MQINSVGIVGYGAFGALVHTLLTRFAPSVEVKVYAHEKTGGEFAAFEEVAKSDAVVLAVPIHAYEEVIQRIVPLLNPDAVLVDVATVKTHTVGLLKRFAKDVRYIATHPMWGPESYAKRDGDVAGFRIVISEHTLLAADHSALIDLLKSVGFDVVEVSAEEHDKHLAETLFLTHFVGQLITRAGFGRTEIDTVSFGYLMDAVESVKHDEALFKDVFRFNPYCKDVLTRIENAEGEVRSVLSGN